MEKGREQEELKQQKGRGIGMQRRGDKTYREQGRKY